MWNLLSNAIKFTPTGGQVQICLKQVDAQVEITVSDTGLGINPDFLPYVFDRFRQHDSTTTRRFGGLGLGLAIVRQLVELHGGTVTVASLGVGQGTTFTIELPAIVPHQPSSDPHSSNSIAQANGEIAALPTLAGLQILVVEDEADALELLSTILQEYGAEVIAAASVRAALAILETSNDQSLDVLVSDIGMPDEDGYSLIRKLRQLEELRGGRMPAIALTAYASSDDRKQALLAGFQMHLTKPVEAAELVTVVASLTGRTQRI